MFLNLLSLLPIPLPMDIESKKLNQLHFWVAGLISLLLYACSSGGDDEEEAAAPAATVPTTAKSVVKKATIVTTPATDQDRTSTEGSNIAPSTASCGDTPHGGSVTRLKYQSSSVAYGQSCNSETQISSCGNGNMSGYSVSFTHDSCVVLDPVAPVIALAEIILDRGYTEQINLADMQTGSPVDTGNYYHQCYFDQTIDGATAEPR